MTCSTLVIRQKLPGIYVQPSYKSALSKDLLLHVHTYQMWLFVYYFLNVQPLLCNKTKCNSLLTVAVSVDGIKARVSRCVVWFGVIFIRHGLYQDGVFKFTVYIPDNYPDGECPVSMVDSLMTKKTYFVAGN